MYIELVIIYKIYNNTTTTVVSRSADPHLQADCILHLGYCPVTPVTYVAVFYQHYVINCYIESCSHVLKILTLDNDFK